MQVLAALACAAMMHAPAMAGGSMKDDYSPRFSWTGAYAGFNVGYADGSYTQFSAFGTGVNVGIDDIVAGGTVGYNYQIGNFVVGIEADISTGPEGTTAQGTAGPTWNCNTGACNADIAWFGTVRGRLGFAADKWLFFGTGGYAYGKSQGGIFNSAQQGSGVSDGWTAGGGLEYAMTSNIIVKAEYLHVNLGDIRFGTGAVGTERFKGDGDFNVFRAGLNVKF